MSPQTRPKKEFTRHTNSLKSSSTTIRLAASGSGTHDSAPAGKQLRGPSGKETLSLCRRHERTENPREWNSNHKRGVY